MGRKSNVLLTTLGCLGMAAGAAFAGQLDAGNTKVAAEKIPAATALVAGTAANVVWQSSSPLAPTTGVDITIANGSFGANAGGAIKLCVGGTLVSDPGLATIAGDTATSLTLSGAVSTSDAVLVTNAATCGAAALTLAGLQIAAGTQAGTQVDMAITVPTAIGGNATGPIFNVINQFTAEIVPVTSTLSFVDFQELFVATTGAATPPSSSTTSSRGGLILHSDATIPGANAVTVTPVGPCRDTLAAGDGIEIETTGNFDGLFEQRHNATVDPFTAGEISAGMSTMTVPGTDLFICQSDDAAAQALSSSDKAATFRLRSDGAGDGIPIQSGDRTIELNLNPTGGGDFGAGNTRTLFAAGTLTHTFVLDGTTFFIPLIKWDPANGIDTFTKLSSSSMIPGAGGVTGVILTDDGTYANCAFSSIVAGTASVISGADWDACVTAAGKTANLAAGQSAKVIVNAPEANVQGLTNLAQLGTVQRVPMQLLNGDRGE